MPTLNKLEYLDETKSQIRTALNQFEAGITEEDTFRSYVSKINVIYNNWAKVTGEDTSITLNNTKKGKMLLETSPSELIQETTPTPENPSEVQVIKGNNSIKIENKNLLYWTRPTQGTVVENDDGSFTLNYTYAQALIMVMTGELSAGTYTIKNYGDIILYVQSSSSDYSHYASKDGGSYTFTYDGTSYLKFLYGNTTANTTQLFKVQLEKGSIASDYVAHQEQVLPLNLPVKNLFDKNNIENNKYVKSADGDLANLNGYIASDYIEITPNTQYYWNDSADRTNQGAFYNSSKTYISGISNRLFTTPSNAKYVRLTSESSLLDTLQLEKGDKANRYTPFGTTPIEYCKIGDYEDEFEHDGDKWYLNKYIGKRTLNGSESWGSSGSYYYLLFNDKRSLTTYTPNLIISNYFKAMQYSGGSPNIGCFSENYYTTGNRNVFFNYNGSSSDVDGFKTWLSTHNTTVYYVLETPTHTEITDSTLISQLNAIEQAVSYDEQTNISQTNAELPFIISASALIKGGN